MKVPPKLVRRLVIAPLVVAAEAVLVVLSPLILLARWSRRRSSGAGVRCAPR